MKTFKYLLIFSTAVSLLSTESSAQTKPDDPAAKKDAGAPAAAPAAAPRKVEMGADISLDVAKKVAAAAAAEAKKNDWRLGIAIYDNAAHLVYFEKMDGAAPSVVDVANDKARSAALFRRPTKAFMEGVEKEGRTGLLNLANASPLQGGLPIMMDGKMVGSIGVSGSTGAQDEQAAQAGLTAVK